MTLGRAIVFLDLESTSADPMTARIIEFAVALLATDGGRSQWCQRFNPGIPIPPEATEVHGITDRDVAGCPSFSQFAKRIQLGLRGKDLAGYNLRRYDLPLLDEEMRRSGLRLELDGVRVIDCARIFFRKEQRRLADAVRRYAPAFAADHACHSALSDALATLEVFRGQLETYPDLAGMSLDKLADYSRLSERREADLAGKLYIDTEGDVCFAFGKYQDQKVRLHSDYAEWMLSKDFPGSTKDCLRAELRRLEEVQA
jgi:DNA polymerase-3 subunit epsilon